MAQKTTKSFSSEVTALVANFESRMNVRPTKLYVGAIEWEELRDLAAATGFIMDKVAHWYKRSEYAGMKIYSVDDTSYLGVGE